MYYVAPPIVQTSRPPPIFWTSLRLCTRWLSSGISRVQLDTDDLAFLYIWFHGHAVEEYVTKPLTMEKHVGSGDA